MYVDKDWRSRETDPEGSNVYLDIPRTDDETEALIQDIMSDWKQMNHYYLYMSNRKEVDPMDVKATVYPNNLLLHVSKNIRWWSTPALMQLVLHEIGHVVHGHNHDHGEDAWQNHHDEFQADEFAIENVEKYYGYVPQTAPLCLLNAYPKWFWDLTCLSHPCSRDRWMNLARYDFLPKNYHRELRELGLSMDRDNRLEELLKGE